MFLDFFLGNRVTTVLFSGNLDLKDVASLEIEGPFTKERIEVWGRLNFNRSPPSLSHMPIWYNSLVRIEGKDANRRVRRVRMPIWYNSLVRIEDKPLFYKSWYLAGIKKVSNLLDETS